MSDPDALMAAIEKDPFRSTITSVSLLDESPNRIRFEQQMERATCEVPRLRRRVVSAPFNLGLPEFAIGPNFDPKYHVGVGSAHRAMGRCATFSTWPRRLMSGLDRARPTGLAFAGLRVV